METSRAGPMKLEMAQTIVVGAFNPYVVSPGWLARYVAWARDAEVELKLAPIGWGTSFDLVKGSHKVAWQIDNQRLSVSCSGDDGDDGGPQVDCGRLVSEVLTLLPHTPIRAIGHNFHFQAPLAEWDGRPLPQLVSKGAENPIGAKHVQWVGVFDTGDARLELTLAKESDLVAVLFNFHRTIDADRVNKATSPDEQIDQARTASERFLADYTLSCERFEAVFGESTG